MDSYGRFKPNDLGQPGYLYLPKSTVRALGLDQGPLRVEVRGPEIRVWSDPEGDKALRWSNAAFVSIGRLPFPVGARLHNLPFPARVEGGCWVGRYEEVLSEAAYQGIRYAHLRREDRPMQELAPLARGDSSKRYSEEALLEMVALLRAYLGREPTVHAARTVLNGQFPHEIVTRRLGWQNALIRAPVLDVSPEEALERLRPYLSDKRRAGINITLEADLIAALEREALEKRLSLTEYIREILRHRQPLDVKQIEVDSPAKAGHLVRMAKTQGARLTAAELLERGLPPYHDGEWLRQQLEAGYSFRQLAERYGYSPEAYRKAAKQLGLSSRFAKKKGRH